jgi:hypothetical protein
MRGGAGMIAGMREIADPGVGGWGENDKVVSSKDAMQGDRGSGRIETKGASDIHRLQHLADMQ